MNAMGRVSIRPTKAWGAGLLALAVLFSWSSEAFAKGSRTTPLSEFFVLKGDDIYARSGGDRLEKVGTRLRETDTDFSHLSAVHAAVSADGRSVVFLGWGHAATKRSKPERGIYRYVHGEGLALLVSDADLGSTAYGMWDREFPPHLIAFSYKPGAGEPFARTEWALTADGEKLPLALVGASSLHWAAFEGRTEDCVELVEAGTSVDALTYWDFTALDLAIIRGHEATAVRLLALGASPGASRYPALHRAATYGRVQVARALLDGGAEVNSMVTKGFTPYDLTVTGRTALPEDRRFFNPGVSSDDSRFAEVAELLLAAGADPDLGERTREIDPSASVPARYVDVGGSRVAVKAVMVLKAESKIEAAPGRPFPEQYPAYYALWVTNESASPVWVRVDWTVPNQNPESIFGKAPPGELRSFWMQDVGEIEWEREIVAEVRAFADEREKQRLGGQKFAFTFGPDHRKALEEKTAEAIADHARGRWVENLVIHAFDDLDLEAAPPPVAP